MKYRGFGKIGWDVSILGFGVMTLPRAEGEGPHFDETESIIMIRNAIDQGVNYIDSGYPFDMNQHESRARLLNLAFQDNYMKKIRIAATLPLFQIHSKQDFDRCLDDQIQWLKIEKIDFCILGWLNRENWPRLREMGLISWAEQAIKDGRIDKLGFSFYDDFQCLRKILDDYDNWHFCQFRYSYMDVNPQPGTGGMKYAAERGLAVVVSEPLRNGKLAQVQPVSIAKVWDDHGLQGRSLAEWGLNWVWNYPEVSVVVSNMSSMSQLQDYISYADSIEPDSFFSRFNDHVIPPIKKDQRQTGRWSRGSMTRR